MRSLPAFCCGYTAFLFSIAEKRRWGNGKVSSIGTAQADSSERGPTGFSISVFGRFTVHFVCSVRTLQTQYPPISDKIFVNSRTPDIGKVPLILRHRHTYSMLILTISYFPSSPSTGRNCKTCSPVPSHAPSIFTKISLKSDWKRASFTSGVKISS